MELREIENLQVIRGVLFPSGPDFRQFIITGPPGAGKTSLIQKIGGWPDEAYVDLTARHWWRDKALSYRPRGVHLGFPFVGHAEALTVFEDQWLGLAKPTTLDLERIRVPGSVDGFWKWLQPQRLVFEFLLPPPRRILLWRQRRARRGLFPADRHLSLEIVERQVAAYRAAAEYFHACRMGVYVRESIEGMPLRIHDTRNVEQPEWPA